MVKFVLILSIAFSFCYADLPYIITDLLPTIDQMEHSTKDFGELAKKKLNSFMNASTEKRYDDAYDDWASLCGSFFNLQLLYYQTISLTPNVIVKGYAGSNLLEIHGLFRKCLKDKNVLDVFLKNALEADLLTPFQRFLTEKIIEGSQISNEQY